MPTLEARQVFERYRIIEWLGSGVSGESYEAEDTLLLRKVTLKLIHPKTTLPDSARRQFFREMQSISILNHPYLASVLDYGEMEGKLYVARRYVSNGSLLGSNGRLWFHAPLNIIDAIKYAHQLAQVLQHIHNRGYLHGGLTFSNVLVLRGPNIENEADYAPFLLADVGLTNFVRRFGQQQTMPLPVSAAPEQLGKRVIPASDQFALAVLLYFWLTGHPPYIGSPEEIEYLKLTETIKPPSFLNAKVTIEQGGMILRALSVYPEDRYPSVLAFADALLATITPKPQPIHEIEAVNHVEISQGAGPDTGSEVDVQFPEAPSQDHGLSVETSAVTSAESEPAGPQTHESLSTNGTGALPLPETAPLAKLETFPQADLVISSKPGHEDGARLQPEHSSASDFITGIKPESAPEPTPEPPPQIIPDVPQPLPEPDVPQPTPEPAPDIPQPVPEPSPYPTPQPAPDVPQPLPEPGTPTPAPQPLPQEALSPREELPGSQKHQHEIQDEQAATAARLVITSPYKEKPYEVVLQGEETTIGRAGSSDVLLDQDNLTSRHHALLKREDDHYVIYDRHSANGVQVNGQQLTADSGCELVDGDHINIGNYELTFLFKVPEVTHKESPAPVIPNSSAT